MANWANSYFEVPGLSLCKKTRITHAGWPERQALRIACQVLAGQPIRQTNGKDKFHFNPNRNPAKAKGSLAQHLFIH